MNAKRRDYVWFMTVATLAAIAFSSSSSAASGPSRHTIVCKDSPTPGVRPSTMECAILGRKRIAALPVAPTAYFETFPTIESARRAENRASVIIRSRGKIWLLSLRSMGTHSQNGTIAGQVGPLPIPRAPSYEFLAAEVVAMPGSHSRVHTHPGPEAWYLLAGEQCLEMPRGVVRAKAGDAVFAPPNTPMILNVTGTAPRDALFIVVYDATRPWTMTANWKPAGACR